MAAGDKGIGTTRRGIGPAYADKMHRSTAIRVCDLLHEEKLRDRINRIAEERNRAFAALYGRPPLDAAAIFNQYSQFGRQIAPFVDDTGYLLIKSARAGKRILFEGAHAALLDVDHGTYPFVTSSSCSALGIFTGAGVPPQMLKTYIGIMKAYSTRVGAGPFPTEQDNATGNYIRERGNEYGTTTRRPRRCGWFDAMAVRYSADLCGITWIGLMLLDVLGGLDELKICTGYTLNGRPMEYYRADIETLAAVEPVYETMPGWKEDISTCRNFDQLPLTARQYVLRLEQLIGVPIRMVSVGPERSATIMR
jgi:adenylosuccinate synthase